MKLTENILRDSINQDIQARKIPEWSQNKVYAERYRLKHLILGLCLYCPKPAVSPSVKCKKHLLYERMLRKKLLENKKCFDCGIILNPEIDTSKIRCTLCLDKNAFSQRINRR